MWFVYKWVVGRPCCCMAVSPWFLSAGKPPSHSRCEGPCRHSQWTRRWWKSATLLQGMYWSPPVHHDTCRDKTHIWNTERHCFWKYMWTIWKLNNGNGIQSEWSVTKSRQGGVRSLKHDTSHTHAQSMLRWSNMTHWKPAELSQGRWSSESSWQNECQSWSCLVPQCCGTKHLWTACCGGAWLGQSDRDARTLAQRGWCQHLHLPLMPCSWRRGEHSRWTHNDQE